MAPPVLRDYKMMTEAIQILQRYENVNKIDSTVIKTGDIQEIVFTYNIKAKPVDDAKEEDETTIMGYSDSPGEHEDVLIKFKNKEEIAITMDHPVAFRMADYNKMVVETSSLKKFEQAYLNSIAEGFGEPDSLYS